MFCTEWDMPENYIVLWDSHSFLFWGDTKFAAIFYRLLILSHSHRLTLKSWSSRPKLIRPWFSTSNDKAAVPFLMFIGKSYSLCIRLIIPTYSCKAQTIHSNSTAIEHLKCYARANLWGTYSIEENVNTIPRPRNLQQYCWSTCQGICSDNCFIQHQTRPLSQTLKGGHSLALHSCVSLPQHSPSSGRQQCHARPDCNGSVGTLFAYQW